MVVRETHWQFLLHVVALSISSADAVTPAPVAPVAAVPVTSTTTTTTTTTTTNDLWEVASQNTCQGAMTEFDDCPDLPDCTGCVQIDCQFNTWADWTPPSVGACTGICSRSRSIFRQNSECGTPCEGAKTETKRCTSPGCLKERKDCLLSDWSHWSPQTCAVPTDQRYRNRHVITSPANGGTHCEADLRETAPCTASPSSVDCEFSTWHSWTVCSKPCNTGRMTRMRSVAKEAENGGIPCQGAMESTIPCNTHPCRDASNCVLSNWGQWSGCHAETPNQKFRSREVQTPAMHGGAACDGPLKETVGCSSNPQECKLSEWSNWEACDQSCDGGQTFRDRRLLAPATDGGRCPEQSLRETIACGTQSCEVAGPNDCQLSNWETWSDCSARCGWGLKSRSRRVTALANGGKGCQGALEEVLDCEDHNCQVVDCQWDLWSDWSACTCTCGGGTKRRTRVVKIAPENKGRDCVVQPKAEVGPCATQPCDSQCVDGEWDDWTPWSQCSATCDAGFKSRRREVRIEPNVCGRPASGVSEEYKECDTMTPCIAHKDCKLSEWAQWSACSCTCFGVRERHRTIQQYRSGEGQPCVEDSLKTIEPCNPAEGGNVPEKCNELAPQRDCELDKWNDWTKCSATCGGGQKSRSRHIFVPPAGGGLPCTDTLAETTACNSQSCAPPHCLDCRWGQWSEWGGCTKCGGQRWRHRSVEQLPNYCGRRCDPRSAKEVSPCESFCEPTLFCAWSAWSEWAECPGQCGTATTRRHRSLGIHRNNRSDFLFKGTGSLTCTGTQFSVDHCPEDPRCDQKCVPKNCEFGQWAEWNAPSCTGLCERHRVVSTINNDCGNPCSGPLIDTKRCEPDCVKPQDCLLGFWGMWSHCSSREAQRYRIRGIKRYPANRGEPCRGALRETATCDLSAPPQDCELSQWSAWGRCSRTCGSGWKTRNRRIKLPARGGGTPCTDSLEELQECTEKGCDGGNALPCIVGDWLQWSGCRSDAQMYRSRQILRYALHGGTGCTDPLEETMACRGSDVDCRVSPWTIWSACDVTCGVGQQQRHRQVDNYPLPGGMACPVGLSLSQTMGCSSVVNCAPDNDCKLGLWSQWSSCSATCGVGQSTRARVVEKFRKAYGAGCVAPLSETMTCTQGNCSQTNCLWGDWSFWSDCTRKCDGGEQSRGRHIVQAPTAGGDACEAKDKEQMRPCNTVGCPHVSCVDGEWGTWAPWETCSRSCDGGITWRSRIVAKPPSSCGRKPEGLSQEAGACNKGIECVADLDCKFTIWSIWSTCSASCFGTMSRTRRVQQHGRGTGLSCSGSLNEVRPCQPGQGEQPSLACPVAGHKVDCVIAAWSQWSPCTVTCGGGQRTRQKRILVEAQRGGNSCSGSLAETNICAAVACASVGTTKVDCTWGQWSEWGACDRCGGQRKRFRHVISTPQNGGALCNQEASEETDPCTRHCHEQYYCAWADWQSWGSCPASCGHGKRSRKRVLELRPQLYGARLYEEEPAVSTAHSRSEALSDQQDDLHTLYRRQKQIEDNRFTELSVAFGSGCFSLMVLLFVSRVCTRLRHGPQGYSPHLQQGPFISDGD